MSERYPGGIISKTPVTPSGPYETSTASGIWTLDQQLQYAKQGLWPTAGRPVPDFQFNYVTLLLHGDGTNGTQNNTFIDSSTNNFTLTRNGNSTQGSFSPYGSNWSNNFDGTGDYLTVAGTSTACALPGDFTIEFWYFQAATVNYGSLFSTTTTYITTNSLRISTGNNNNTFEVASGGSGIFSASTSFSSGVWYHVALVRSGTTLTLYQNGVSVGSATNSQSFVSSTFIIGDTQGEGAPYALKGYISNFRLVKGTAVYTAAFTPPTSPLTAITNTQLLTCQNNRFIDNSTNAFAITVNGNPSVQRFNPFGTATAYSTSVIGGSGYFDGIGAYLQTPSSSAFAFGTGDFTCEAWVYSLDVSNASQRGFMQTSATAGGLSTSFSAGIIFVFGTPNGNGCINVNVGGTTYASSGGAVKANTWTHIAVTRASGAVKVFVDGAIVVSGTGNTNNLTGTYACIGGYYDTSYLYQGYLSDVRIVKGTAVYTAAFTPNTAPLTAITNTSLLTNMINGAIFDNAMMNDCLTVNNAQVSSTQVKFGTGSMKFVKTSSSVGDFLSFPKSPNYDLSGGAFTIEGWIYPTSNTGYCTIVSRTPTIWVVGMLDNQLYWYNGAATNTTTATITFNTWTHFAVTGDGTTVRIFLNGVLDKSLTGVNPQSGLGTLNVGAPANGEYGGRYTDEFYTGYIDDLRITKGFCRYTATFTPPTAAFPDIGPT